MQSDQLASRHIVLLGVGHTNAHIVRKWQEEKIPDTDLTCISDFGVATYSGMLPAVLAGQLPESEMKIDLLQLCGSAGATLITDRVAGLDLKMRELKFFSRPPVPFDVLSIGVGSQPTTEGVSIEGASLLEIKPMQTFLSRLSSIVRRVSRRESTTLRVVVVGGGVAGAEVSLCLPDRLQKLLTSSFQIALVTRDGEVPSGTISSVQSLIAHELSARGITVHRNKSVSRVTDSFVETDDGQQIPADLVIWATGANPPTLLSDFELPKDERGFLLSDRTLRSVSGDPVFVVGDTGTIDGEKIPKAGVYAVRQGPVLWENLRRTLESRDLQKYNPQRSFMRLINLGDDRAIGQWRGLSFSGKWVLRLKHRIDQQFMQMHKPMMMIDDDNVMQCNGCGCKLGPEPLESALAAMEGNAKSVEDAVPVGDSSSGWVASTDFFAAPVRDPYLMGRITALHSASDMIASGASVTQALANVVLPPGDVKSQQRVLKDFTQGAAFEFEMMGASISGGHTIVGKQLEAGFTVFGKLLGRRIEKSNLRVGDQLFLTRPLGVGIVFAAEMRNRCPADVYQSMMKTILTPQDDLAELAAELGIDAGTDITGFGLAGHLVEMLRSSGVNASVSLESVPILDGVLELSTQGIESSLAPDNRLCERWIDAHDSAGASEKYPVLFDPQTCGGLLFGVGQELVDEFVQRSESCGAGCAIWIGEVGETTDSPQLRVISSRSVT